MPSSNFAETDAKPSPVRLPRLDAVRAGGNVSPHVRPGQSHLLPHRTLASFPPTVSSFQRKLESPLSFSPRKLAKNGDPSFRWDDVVFLNGRLRVTA